MFKLAADDATDDSAKDRSAKGNPTVVVIAVMVYVMDGVRCDVMSGWLMPLRRGVVFLGCGPCLDDVLLGRFLMFRRLVFRRWGASIVTTAARSGNGSSAESNACNRCNQ